MAKIVHSAVEWPNTYRRIAGVIGGQGPRKGTLCGGYRSTFWNVPKEGYAFPERVTCKRCLAIMRKEKK